MGLSSKFRARATIDTSWHVHDFGCCASAICSPRREMAAPGPSCTLLVQVNSTPLILE